MSFPTPPARPTGDSPAAIYMQRLWDIHWDPKTSIFVDTPELKFNKTSKGYVPVIRIPAQSVAAPAAPSSDKQMVITQLGSSLSPANYDLLICKEWDPVANGIKSGAVNVYVAKTIEARRTITNEFFFDNGDNVVQTYTYFAPASGDPSYGDNFRLATDGGISPNELQVMEKRYYSKAIMPVTAGVPAVAISLAQCLVMVRDIGAPTGVKDPNGADVTHIEVKPFRTWGRYATQ